MKSNQWAIAGAVLTACLASLSATACQGADAPSATPTTGGRGPTSPAACAMPALGPVEQSSVLVAGPVNGVPPTTARGERLVLVAVVLDPACRPARGARLNIWHTDSTGLYGPKGTESCCYYGGMLATDENGRFRLETIRPAQYPVPNAPPAHIHMEIRHASGISNPEIVFSDAKAGPAPVRPGDYVTLHLSRAPGQGEGWYGEMAFVLE